MAGKLDEIDAELSKAGESLEKVFSEKKEEPKAEAPSSAPVIQEPVEEKTEEEHLQEIKQAVNFEASERKEEEPVHPAPDISLLDELKRQVKEEVGASKEQIEALKEELSSLEESASEKLARDRETIRALQEQMGQIQKSKEFNAEEEIRFVEESLLQTVEHLTTQADKINELITEMNGIKSSVANLNYNHTKHFEDVLETIRILEKNIQYLYSQNQPKSEVIGSQTPIVR